MVNDIKVGDIVRFKLPEFKTDYVGEVVRLYDIIDDIDPEVIGTKCYIIMTIINNLPVNVLAGFIREVYRKLPTD